MLSTSVNESLTDAEQSLRNVGFSARGERPLVCTTIADMISKIESLKSTDEILDKLENRKEGDSGSFGSWFLVDSMLLHSWPYGSSHNA